MRRRGRPGPVRPRKRHRQAQNEPCTVVQPGEERLHRGEARGRPRPPTASGGASSLSHNLGARCRCPAGNRCSLGSPRPCSAGVGGPPKSPPGRDLLLSWPSRGFPCSAGTTGTTGTAGRWNRRPDGANGTDGARRAARDHGTNGRRRSELTVQAVAADRLGPSAPRRRASSTCGATSTLVLNGAPGARSPGRPWMPWRRRPPTRWSRASSPAAMRRASSTRSLRLGPRAGASPPSPTRGAGPNARRSLVIDGPITTATEQLRLHRRHRHRHHPGQRGPRQRPPAPRAGRSPGCRRIRSRRPAKHFPATRLPSGRPRWLGGAVPR